jgi:hypothetical protein
MRNTLIVFLLLVMISSLWWFWLMPLANAQKAAAGGKDKTDALLKSMPLLDAPLGPPPPGAKYEQAKKEIKDWLDIGGKAVPIFSFIGALWLRKKGRKTGERK